MSKSTAIELQSVDGLKPSKHLIDTAIYDSASELRATLEYGFSQKKDFSYKGLSTNEIIHHLDVFISRLWQIHIFGERNTKTIPLLKGCGIPSYPKEIQRCNFSRFHRLS